MRFLTNHEHPERFFFISWNINIWITDYLERQINYLWSQAAGLLDIFFLIIEKQIKQQTKGVEIFAFSFIWLE